MPAQFQESQALTGTELIVLQGLQAWSLISQVPNAIPTPAVLTELEKSLQWLHESFPSSSSQ